jgi:hypothetical protein
VIQKGTRLIEARDTKFDRNGAGTETFNLRKNKSHRVRTFVALSKFMFHGVVDGFLRINEAL